MTAGGACVCVCVFAAQGAAPVCLLLLAAGAERNDMVEQKSKANTRWFSWELITAPQP